jgi:hypothetical protein
MIEFKSAGATRSGKRVQAHFKVDGQTRCWTLTPTLAEQFKKQFDRGGTSRDITVYQMLASMIGGDTIRLRQTAQERKMQHRVQRCGCPRPTARWSHGRGRRCSLA